MTAEDRVKELEIAVADMQRVLDNVRQFAEELENDPGADDSDPIVDELFQILEGYGKSNG